MIRKVSFRNFKAYRSLDMELEPFTVLVGPNASGKTTLLEGLRVASQAAQELMAGGRGFWPVDPLVQSYGVKAPVELGIAGEWRGTTASARVISDSQPQQLRGGETFLAFKMTGTWNGVDFSAGEWSGTIQMDNPPNIFGEIDKKSLDEFRAQLASTAVLQFEPRRMAEASYSEEPLPSVLSDGSGLASVLAYLKLSQDEVFNEIEQLLKQVVPSVRRIRIERSAVEQTVLRTISLDEQQHQVSERRRLWGNQIVLDMKGAKGVPASAAGEGTLMVLGLLTVLKGHQPKLVLLDDIELSLHPAAQAKLIEVLRKIQERQPDLQIVATSHSPFILNYLDPKEVRMTFLAENGFARCEKLTAHPEFEQWKDLMRPGEFWSTVGESWVGEMGTSASHE